MATTWKAPTWRMPNEKNQSKLESYSLSLDGSNEYVDLNSGVSMVLLPTNEPRPSSNGNHLLAISSKSYSCWFKVDTTGTKTIFSSTPTGGGYHVKLDVNSSNLLEFGLRTPSPTYTLTTGTTTIAIDTWYHVLITVDGTNNKLYVNGTLEGTTACSGNMIFFKNSSSSNPKNLIGGHWVTSSTQDFDGSISDLVVFDYALSESQISSLYNSGSPINPMTLKPAPIAYYPLGGNASTGGDSTNTLSVPNVAVPDASVFDFVPNDYIDCGNISTLNGASTATFSAWFNTDVTSALILMGTDTQFYIQVWAANNRIDFITPAATQYRTTAPTINDGEWYHLTIVFNKDGGSHTERYKGYINGVYYANERTTSTSDALPTTSNSFELGKYGSIGSQFNGKMSNIAIWNSDQSSEISNIYNSGVPATTYTNTPTAWYKLDQSANWEADTAGNWQIPDAVSSYPQSFNFSQNKTITTPNAFSDIITGSNKMGVCTISYWYKSSGTGQRDYMSLNDETSALSAKFRVDSSNRFYYLETNNYLRFVAQTNLDEWNHHCWVFNSATSYSGTAGQTNGDLQFYVNGVVQAVDFDFSATPANSPWDRFNIARADQTSGAGLDFEMSNLMLYSTNFSASQVLQLYNNGTPLTTAIATDNLKAWYKLDNTEFYDTFNTTNKWMINNNLSTSFNKCFWMNPLGIQVSSTLGYQDGTTAFSGAAWVNISSGNCPIISRQRGRLSSGTYPGWTFGTTGSGLAQGDPQFKLHTNTNGAINVKSLSNTFQDGKWHFLAFTYDGSQDASGVKLYVDGYEDTNRQVLQNNLTGIMSDYNTPFMIGGSYNSYLNNRYGTNQFMSNAMYFESELSASNILTLYNNGIPLNDLSSFTTVKGWWKLDDTATYGTGWTVPDASGNGNTGTSDTTMPITNRVDFIPAISSGVSSGMTEQNLVNNNVSALNGESSGMDTSNLVTSTVTRQVPYNSYSLNFDSGNPDKITGTGALISGNESRSFSLWYKTSSTVAQIPFSLGSPTDQTNGAQFAYCINRSSTTNAAIFGKNSAYDTSVFTVPNTSDGNWHHLVVTYNQSALNVYIDGNLEATPALPSTSYITSAGFTIGGWTMVGNRPFDGELSNISVFNEALTSTEVLKIYNSGVPGDLSSFNPSPIAWWSLGSDSYYNGANYICPDLIGTNNGTSSGMGANALVGNAPNSIANGTSTNMAIDANLTGNAPNSSNNSFSVNMSYDDRETSVPS